MDLALGMGLSTGLLGSATAGEFSKISKAEGLKGRGQLPKMADALAK